MPGPVTGKAPDPASRPGVLLVDLLAEDRGHLLEDDLYLSECISRLATRFMAVTSPASVANIRGRLAVPTLEVRKRPWLRRFVRAQLFLAAMGIPCEGYGDVVFQSFEEVSTCFFKLMHPGVRVHLVVTNNLRPDRIKRHPFLGPLLMRAVFGCAATIIVHCRHEVDQIVRIVPGINRGKICIKPFHQISAARKIVPFREKKPDVLFVGPAGPHKGIQPVLDLIASDKDRRYNYLLCRMDRDLPKETAAFLESRDNVRISSGYLASEDYYRHFSESSLVILTHNEDFEGTLSGIFCDAIASGTAVIARDMAPHDEYFERFGPMGFLVDYGEDGWCEKILGADLESMYGRFGDNMAACRSASGPDGIKKVFTDVLGRRA